MIMDNELKTPSILVEICEADENIKREVLAGIEEESIPYEARTSSIQDEKVLEKCYRSAQESRLGVGIVIKQRRVIVQYNKLKETRPLLDMELESYEGQKARNIGSNAARLYKRMPFKELDHDLDDDIVERIKNRVIEIIKAKL